MRALVWLLTLVSVTAASERTFYVDPTGDDTWDGTRPKAEVAQRHGPFRTLQRATRAVASLRRAGYRGRVVVELAPGTYRLRQPWVLEPEVSGSSDGATVFRAARPGTAIISGGLPLGPWTGTEDGLWQTSLPPDVEYVYQLFVNGSRRRRARTPNAGYFRALGPLNPWRDRTKARRDPAAKIGLRVRPEELRSIPAENDVQIVVYHSWTASRHHIRRLDPERGEIEFTAPANWPIGYWDRHPRWYAESFRAALDAPGEWYLDRRKRTIVYRPLPGEKPDTARAEVPVVQELLQLRGNPAKGRFVTHVVFDGLVFEYTDWSLGREERCDGQAAAFLATAAVHAWGARHCVWRNCIVRHVGTYGLWLDEGSQQNVVERCAFLDLGAGGIRIGQASLPAAAERRAERNTVQDCLVRAAGRVYPAGVGIWIGRSSYNVIQHNHICDLFYTGISVGWSWGYAPSSAHDNKILFNRIHNLGQGELSDMGGIYTLGISPGTILQGNVIHDVESYSYGGWGIYPDEGSSFLLIRDNLVYRTKTGGFHQHYGKENRVVNNIFAFARLQQLQRTRREPHISFYFEKNIVVYDQGTLMSGAWDDGRFVMDYNVYWNYAGAVLFPGHRTLKQWQSLGHDLHSVVADPQFANAMQHDYRLLPGSPARRLGFQPLVSSRAGVRRELLVSIHEGSP